MKHTLKYTQSRIFKQTANIEYLDFNSTNFIPIRRTSQLFKEVTSEVFEDNTGPNNAAAKRPVIQDSKDNALPIRTARPRQRSTLTPIRDSTPKHNYRSPYNAKIKLTPRSVSRVPPKFEGRRSRSNFRAIKIRSYCAGVEGGRKASCSSASNDLGPIQQAEDQISPLGAPPCGRKTLRRGVASPFPGPSAPIPAPPTANFVSRAAERNSLANNHGPSVARSKRSMKVRFRAIMEK